MTIFSNSTCAGYGGKVRGGNSAAQSDSQERLANRKNWMLDVGCSAVGVTVHLHHRSAPFIIAAYYPASYTSHLYA